MSAPCSEQTTTPTPHHSVFTGRMPFLPPNQQRQSFGLVWVEFNAPPDTIEVISEAVFTANHLTDTDKQNNTGIYKQTQ